MDKAPKRHRIECRPLRGWLGLSGWNLTFPLQTVDGIFLQTIDRVMIRAAL
jgi:hypothetical protein